MAKESKFYISATNQLDAPILWLVSCADNLAQAKTKASKLALKHHLKIPVVGVKNIIGDIYITHKKIGSEWESTERLSKNPTEHEVTEYCIRTYKGLGVYKMRNRNDNSDCFVFSSHQDADPLSTHLDFQNFRNFVMDTIKSFQRSWGDFIVEAVK